MTALRARALTTLVSATVFLHVAVALGMIFGGSARSNTRAFAVARDIMPLDGWAAVFAAVAVVISTALATRRPRLLAWGSALGAGLCVWWAVLAVVGVVTTQTAPWIGIVLWVVAAASHIAVAMSATYPGRLRGG